MRSLEEIKKDYKATEVGDKLVPLSGYTRVYGMANEDKRNQLKKEYEAGLSEDQQLAIFMHEKLCHYNHTNACSFYYEVKEGFIHDWAMFQHAEYLKKAQALLAVVDYETAVKAVIAIME